MLTHRHVLTSTKDFYEIRKGNNVVHRFTHQVNLNDIVILFSTNDVVYIYALENGHHVYPEQYGSVAEAARKMLKEVNGGQLLYMGQLWISKSTRILHIANVGLGAFKTSFKFNPVSRERHNWVGLNGERAERKLTRILKEETKSWQS